MVGGGATARYPPSWVRPESMQMSWNGCESFILKCFCFRFCYVSGQNLVIYFFEWQLSGCRWLINRVDVWYLRHFASCFMWTSDFASRILQAEVTYVEYLTFGCLCYFALMGRGYCKRKKIAPMSLTNSVFRRSPRRWKMPVIGWNLKNVQDLGSLSMSEGHIGRSRRKWK